MIFMGHNLRISFPRYYNHHSRWTDSRILPLFIRRWWNRLKEKQPAWQIIEWIIAYRRPYCKKCIKMFIEDEKFLYYDGIRNPTREDRIKIVERLQGCFK